jgi:hypothetical protein
MLPAKEDWAFIRTDKTNYQQIKRTKTGGVRLNVSD